LIDSSDIGKYPAFSKIGSDAIGNDRYSQIPTFLYDSKQTKETSNTTVKVYPGVGMVDQDLFYSYQGKDIVLPAEKSYIIAIILEMTQKENKSVIEQPKGIFYYNGQQFALPLRYLYTNQQIFDYKSGVNATVDLITQVSSVTNQGVQIDKAGAIIYLSPKVTNSVLAQIYLLDNSAGRYSDFKLVHSEPDKYISYLKENGIALEDFVYIAGGLRGPIKIWEITPDESILINKEMLKTSGEYAEFDNLNFIKE
jgi:hypothetical protein